MKISQEDLLKLNIQKSQTQQARLEMDKAKLNFDLEVSNYRYLILSLYRKYCLADDDIISHETGEVARKEQEQEKDEI